jgi:hypothetical protein
MHGSISGSSGSAVDPTICRMQKTNFQEREGGDAKTGSRGDIFVALIGDRRAGTLAEAFLKL